MAHIQSRTALLSCLVALLLAPGIGATRVTAQALDDCESTPRLTLGMSLAVQADAVRELSQHDAAARLYLLAGACGFSREAAEAKAVDAFLQAENAPAILEIFDSQADRGESDFESIESQERLADVIALAEWSAVRAKMLANRTRADSSQEVPETSDSEVIHTQDLANFLEAFRRAEGLDEAAAMEVYDEHYFAKASPGLVDYASIKIRDPERFVHYVQERRPYYEQLHTTLDRLLSIEDRAEAALHELAALVGSSEVPTIYFLVGAHTSAGTATGNGILLGSEFIGEDLDHTDTIPEWVSPFLSTPQTAVWVILHEQVHFVQRNPLRNVLGAVLNEGAADFLADHIFGEASTQERGYVRYGRCHERRLRRRLFETLETDEVSLWTGNNGTEYGPDWHPDLGYYLGAQIVRAYYDRAEDESAALVEIATLENPREIWKASGYATMKLDEPPADCEPCADC